MSYKLLTRYRIYFEFFKLLFESQLRLGSNCGLGHKAHGTSLSLRAIGFILVKLYALCLNNNNNNNNNKGITFLRQNEN